METQEGTPAVFPVYSMASILLREWQSSIVVGCPRSAISLCTKQPVAEKMSNVNLMFYFHDSLYIRAGKKCSGMIK